ncbi:MAG: glycosyltransferase [Candidatus Eisenbacteria bacterium]|uniref:Glycosyltransferase n=1 Tax=Eiseniibacteriota bacterium TaxID=2212470 RepID=A0A956SBC2_UNCEI|nr:glycosyltransferase [Candidatus Eisenbacteria bacterium]MCB9462988.1 glycosyltransferase [Candidatus Eisenbacteria bacterium]
MPRVSVMVSCSGQPETLSVAVQSIMNQSFRDFELIIADDGSTDGTGVEMLKQLGPDPARAEQVWVDSLHEETGQRSIQMIKDEVLVHYLHQTLSRGLGAARNRALAASSGEYIVFVSPGDEWHKRKLEVAVDVMDTHRDLHALVGPKTAPTKKAPPRKRPVPSLVEFEETVTPPGLTLSGAILRRSCLGWEAPFDENLPSCEEFDFWLRIGSRYQIGRLPDLYQAAIPMKERTPWSLDRYRVYSLEKAFQSGHLTPFQRHRVAEVLAERCGKLSSGYKQRDNTERSNFYDRKKKRFLLEVEKLDVSDPLFSGRRPARRRLSSVTSA